MISTWKLALLLTGLWLDTLYDIVTDFNKDFQRS